MQREGERERIREWRRNVTDVQRERERERVRKWRQNFTDEQWAKEQGKGDTISLKSNWRMNEREQEKIDAELAMSGEEESEKQQGETGVV